jgi:hypothetical protein
MSIFLATPMYGGQCTAVYCLSVIRLANDCRREKIELHIQFKPGESLITRARNALCAEFIKSKARSLLFIDADIGFEAADVLALYRLLEQGYGVVGAACPKKRLLWDRIREAARRDIAAAELKTIATNFVVTVDGQKTFDPKVTDRPIAVDGLGTGFLMVDRKIMETFANAFPQYWYNGENGNDTMQYFQAEIDPKTKRYLSEDWWFCSKLRGLGFQTWLCPWIKTTHIGPYEYSGSLAELAASGLSGVANQ